MDKQEFITLLSDALKGEVPPDVIWENLEYYKRYLREEEAKGRREEEILAELGDPRLIAKTIIDACPQSAENQGFEGYESYEESSYGYSEPKTDDGYTGRGSYEERSKFRYIDLSKWYWRLAGIVLLFVVMWVVFTVVGGIFSLLMRFAWPLIIIWIIYIFIRNSRQR